MYAAQKLKLHVPHVISFNYVCFNCFSWIKLVYYLLYSYFYSYSKFLNCTLHLFRDLQKWRMGCLKIWFSLLLSDLYNVLGKFKWKPISIYTPFTVFELQVLNWRICQVSIFELDGNFMLIEVCTYHSLAHRYCFWIIQYFTQRIMYNMYGRD